MRAPNKALVPKDFTVGLGSGYYNEPFSATEKEKTTTDETDLSYYSPQYFVGEYEYAVISGGEIKFQMANNRITNFSWTINTPSGLTNKFRYVRFILNPNIKITNNGTSTNCSFYFSFIINIDGRTFTKEFSFVNNGSMSVGKTAYVYDSISKELTQDLDTSSWIQQ